MPRFLLGTQGERKGGSIWDGDRALGEAGSSPGGGHSAAQWEKQDQRSAVERRGDEDKKGRVKRKRAGREESVGLGGGH